MSHVNKEREFKFTQNVTELTLPQSLAPVFEELRFQSSKLCRASNEAQKKDTPVFRPRPIKPSGCTSD